MSAVYQALPGIEVPVSDISRALERMWADTAASGGPAPAADEVRATQINLVLHLGFGTDPADALVQFKTTVEFSSRHPSRVLVLCPEEDAPGNPPFMRAKLYGECFLGKSKGDTRCCEFVLLNYNMAARQHLESQVSICLQSDLPVYYWMHRFRSCQRLADYQHLIKRSSRLIVDSAVAPEGTLEYPWPNPSALRDMAYARTLPIRQTVGQFLSRYTPQELARDLRRVESSYEAVHTAEGKALMRWLRGRLADCGAEMEVVDWAQRILPHKEGVCFGISLGYRGEKQFAWRGNCDTGIAHFCANFGRGFTELPGHISLLGPVQALSEAMFF